jgi:putative PIN family toxin of toxin-antitoxin system
MRVVLDTNVLISGIFFSGGPPGEIVEKWINGDFTVIFSPAILEEYIAVLLRPKFSKLGTPQVFYDILSRLAKLENSIMVYPQTMVDVIKEDLSDNKFLACAVEGKADIIISGDHHLLNLEVYLGIRITSPSYFINE